MSLSRLHINYIAVPYESFSILEAIKTKNLMRLSRKLKQYQYNHEGHEKHEEGMSLCFFDFLRDLRVLRGEVTIGRIQLGLSR
jgi:hypothetical protein